jgi:hypothetical protein
MLIQATWITFTESLFLFFIRRKIMSKLIEQFLETHRQCTAQNSVFNISPALDQEALAIVEQVHAESPNRNRSNQKPGDTERQQKRFNTALAARLTRLLDKVDLLSKTHYDTLRNAIQRWCPWQANQQQRCLQVQQTLLTLLPAAQKKQELRQLCQEYKNHLTAEIETQAKKDSAQSYFVCSNNRTLLFGAPLENGRKQVQRVIDARPPVEKLLAEPTRDIGKPSQPPSLAVQKYQAVSALQATLSTPVKSATEQLKDFREQFKHQRKVIEQDRDSWAMKFVKGVATVFSFGIAWACGIWNIKGKEAIGKLQTTLNHPSVPVVTCRVG